MFGTYTNVIMHFRFCQCQRETTLAPSDVRARRLVETSGCTVGFYPSVLSDSGCRFWGGIGGTRRALLTRVSLVVSFMHRGTGLRVRLLDATSHKRRPE